MSDHELVCLLKDYLDFVGSYSDFKEYAIEQGYDNLPTPFDED